MINKKKKNKILTTLKQNRVCVQIKEISSDSENVITNQLMSAKIMITVVAHKTSRFEFNVQLVPYFFEHFFPKSF